METPTNAAPAKKAYDGSTSSRNPAATGPIKAPPLNMIDDSAVAFAIRFGGTRLGTMENRAGEDSANIVPCRRDSATRCQTSMSSVRTSNASAICVAKFDISLAIRMCLRLNLSAMTPPTIERNSAGSNDAALTIVTHRSDDVMSNVSHPRAMMSMKNDVIERIDPAQYAV